MIEKQINTPPNISPLCNKIDSVVSQGGKKQGFLKNEDNTSIHESTNVDDVCGVENLMSDRADASHHTVRIYSSGLFLLLCVIKSTEERQIP